MIPHEPKDYAQMWNGEGGDPTFDQIDGFLLAHFNARAVYVDDIPKTLIAPIPINCGKPRSAPVDFRCAQCGQFVPAGTVHPKEKS